MSVEYETVIGLEVHVELATKTKIFCGCSTESCAEPNVHVCPVCMGLPGSLPRLNISVVQKGLLAGMALHCTPRQKSLFYRKSYFYPVRVRIDERRQIRHLQYVRHVAGC